jgi:hypothetical protein
MERKTPASPFRLLAPTAGLVSVPKEMPVVGVKGWIAGARPVVGAAGASGLMLLACSWFAVGTGGLGAFHRDVGSTDPVRIQTPASSAVAPAHKAPAVTATRRAPNRHAAVRSTRADVSRSAGAVRAPQPASRRPTPTPARPATPEVSKPAASAPAKATASAPTPTQAPTQTPQPSPTPPPALPAPLDSVSLPTVSLPPISVPALPTVTVQVPALPTTTLPLGLP